MPLEGEQTEFRPFERGSVRQAGKMNEENGFPPQFAEPVGSPLSSRTERRGERRRAGTRRPPGEIGAAMRVTGGTPWIGIETHGPALQRRSSACRTHAVFQVSGERTTWAGSAWRIARRSSQRFAYRTAPAIVQSADEQNGQRS